MKTKIATILTALLMSTVSFSVFLTGVSVGQPDIMEPMFAGGDGSIRDPYQISNVTELQNISSNLNVHYILMNDIDASETKDWNGGRGFEPIGFYDKDNPDLSFNGYLDGMDYKKPIDEQFILLFLALEKIKDIHGKNKKLTKIITNGKFSKICKDLKEVIQKSLSDNESKFMIEKLSELNRVSLKRVLENLFDHYDIDISDLYPIKADVYPFISIRNKLFHSRTEIDDIVLLKESVRLEYILSRIFLRMLGWSDLSMAPGEYNIWINELRKG